MLCLYTHIPWDVSWGRPIANTCGCGSFKSQLHHPNHNKNCDVISVLEKPPGLGCCWDFNLNVTFIWSDQFPVLLLLPLYCCLGGGNISIMHRHMNHHLKVSLWTKLPKTTTKLTNKRNTTTWNISKMIKN